MLPSERGNNFIVLHLSINTFYEKKILILLFVFVSTFAFSQITVSISKQDASCYGLSNGCAVATASGGQAPYNYYWPATATNSATFCLVPAGQYTVIVTDALTNTVSAVVTITQPAQLSTIISTTPLTCYSPCNGSASAITNGGTPPYTYSWWNGGPITTQITGLGNYTLQVTDANACVQTQSCTIAEIPSTSITINYTNTSCGNNCNGSASVSITGSTGPYAYHWTHNGMSSPNASNLCASQYYTVEAVDANGCFSFSLFTIGNNGGTNIPNVSITSTAYNETCLNSGDGSIDVSINGSNPGPFTYQWSNGATTQDISNLSSDSYWVIVSDNNSNCVTIQDTITSIGTNCGTISGNVFIDNNNDCLKNIGDNDFSGATVMINPGNRLGYSNSLGDYSVNNLPYGTYSITLNTNNNNILPTCTTTLNTIINSGTPNSINNNLTVGFNSGIQPDMLVSAYSNGIVPGFICRVNYYLYNLNYTNSNGILKVTLPPTFIANITNGAPSAYTISGDTVIWNFNNINYINGNGVLFYIDFTTPLSIPLGSIFTTCAYAQPTVPDFNPANNTYCYQRIVSGSFDPNDKSVSPVGIGATGDIAPAETDLTYLIRFQNTGNGPAVNIAVLDTLSANVDVSTFQMLSASHNYNVEILNGNILKWKFNNIMLVDSNTNEPASHGYIQYQIKRNSNNTPGTQIKNTAYIYFDFNEPVVTNTTLNTIAIPNGIITTSNKSNDWVIYPNPSDGTLYISNMNSMIGKQTDIQILNSIGQTVYEETISSNHKTLDLSKLNNGVYFVKIMSDKQTTVKRMVLSK